ncbi:hypothetical protein BV25DRAFT_1443957 [Artomyces pyxidatus]|uniref:Uncharacterized protein n=1 Tax=Artomyces pyxidatus TaxID=48021 RepID=A0ACB8SM59_9AGAM|nr:hypothetical protein BV25DRAFT_1443957 [Artomyces pyxidatus]
MRGLTTTFITAALFSPVARAALNAYAFGSAFSIGEFSPSSSLDIIKVTTTFTPGSPPTTQKGELYVWPGLMTTNDEFLYTAVQQLSPSACGGTATDWCLTAQYVGAAGLLSGSYAAIDGTVPVTLEFTQNANNTWTHTVIMKGAVISQLVQPIGRPTTFGIANECFDECATTTSSQKYTNTTIVLGTATSTFGETALASDAGTTFSTPTTSDGGKTWQIATITVPKGTSQD